MVPVRIYTLSACPYCVNAKRLLSSLGATFEEIRLDDDPALWDRLSAENNGWQTVPMVFVDGVFIGGYDDMAALHRAGGLVPRLFPASS